MISCIVCNSTCNFPLATYSSFNRDILETEVYQKSDSHNQNFKNSDHCWKRYFLGIRDSMRNLITYVVPNMKDIRGFCFYVCPIMELGKSASWEAIS